MIRLSIVLASTALLCASCVGTRKLTDPTLQVRTEKGTELGVSTDYGVVFLGRTAQGGRAEITAWFGDGPGIEPVVIEPIGSGLYTAETEIRLPSVPLSFDDPRPGEIVLIQGRNAHGRWKSFERVVDEPRVLGLLTTIPQGLDEHADQVGAGVYVLPDDDIDQKRLVGLVAGTVELSGKDGPRRYLAIVGPQDLWRLVTRRRDLLRKKRWVYRDDIL